MDTGDGAAQREVLYLGGHVPEGPEEAVKRDRECYIQVCYILNTVRFYMISLQEECYQRKTDGASLGLQGGHGDGLLRHAEEWPLPPTQLVWGGPLLDEELQE